MDADTILGLDKGLFFEELGLLLTAIAAIVGIWIDRDEERPRSFSVWLTVLVVMATFVGAVQAYSGFLNETKLKDDIARILQKIDKIAHQGKADVPALNQVLKDEVTAQSRNNPEVLAQMAQRVADEGGDPKTVFATYLTDNDVQALAGNGKLGTAPVDAKVAGANGEKKQTIRHPATFGTGKATLRPVDKQPKQPQPGTKP